VCVCVYVCVCVCVREREREREGIIGKKALNRREIERRKLVK
jgi:hypothetical protein